MALSVRPSVKRIRPAALLTVLTLACVAISSLRVAPSLALTNGGSITALDSPLTENFDSLGTAGATWLDNTTIPGWYSTRTAYVAGTGSSNTGALYSFGIAGTNAVTDRALGSVASGTTTAIFQAARLTNSTGATITSLDISYTGEQWRNGGNAAAHTLTFQYQVANPGAVTGRKRADDRMDDTRAAEFHGTDRDSHGGRARRQCGAEPHRDFCDADGDGEPRSGNLAALAGS